MHLAHDNDVVHTLPPDRSDQPFGKAILPRGGWRGRLVPDAHGAQSRKPRFVSVGQGLSSGYRRNKTAGTWVFRKADGSGGMNTTVIGIVFYA